MKKLLLALLISIIAIGTSAQKEKNNKPAIVYSLPKTVLVVNVKVTETVQKAGPYFRYAEHYLSMTDVITENRTLYEVSKVEVYRKGLADPSKTFQIDDDGLINLNCKGIICGINKGCSAPKKDNIDCKKKNNQDIDFLSNTVLTEDQLVANSVAKMAENAAKQIYRIRESRINLISGENDKLPADGESLKIMLQKLDETEKSLVELFAGKTTKKTIKKEIEIIPEKELSNEVLCRISSLTGIVDKDDLSGNPIYITLDITKNTTPAVKVGKKEGYFYNLPGLAKIIISNSEKDFFNKELEISQFGSLQKIPCKVLKCKKTNVKYNDKTGALISVGK